MTEPIAAPESAKPVAPLTIMVLDDEPGTVAVLALVLESMGHAVLKARGISEAAAHLINRTPEIAIVDVYLGTDDGLNYVKNLRNRYPDMGIVVISGEDTNILADQALKSGADYFISKPVSRAALQLTLQRLAELQENRQRQQELEQELESHRRDNIFPEILTHSDSMKNILKLIQKVASRDLSVLIFGESGTGKELVARAVHQQSTRAKGHFVELNCAALPANLVESELFGHEKGAFTGAIASRPGKIEQAHGGTLFLDEIGELPLEIQPKLLRALQERRITRVGGKDDIRCDFRLVTATHRDLLSEVRAGTFREDLFYRVAVFPIKLPPLRERRADLELLLIHFLRQEGVINPDIRPEVHQFIRHYHWPGNIREMKNFAQAVPLLLEDGIIDERVVREYFGSRLGDVSDQTPRPFLNPGVAPSPLRAHEGPRPVRKLEDLEREEILYALRVYKGNVPEAAMALSMGRATLYKYIKRHDIELSEFA